MKYTLFIILALSFRSHAFAIPTRVPLYDCAYMGDDSIVEGLAIYRSNLGSRNFMK